MAINLPMFILSYCLYDSTHVHKSASVLGKLPLERSYPLVPLLPVAFLLSFLSFSVLFHFMYM